MIWLLFAAQKLDNFLINCPLETKKLLREPVGMFPYHNNYTQKLRYKILLINC